MEQQNQTNNSNNGLTPEEQQMKEEIETLLKPRIDMFLEKVFSIISWCWPATILLFLADTVFRQFGYYGMSFWGITFFLWFPFAVLISLFVLTIGILYISSLFYAWRKFLDKIWFYTRLGFSKGASN